MRVVIGRIQFVVENVDSWERFLQGSLGCSVIISKLSYVVF